MPAQAADRLLERFNAANITHDGRLTLEQAQAAHMPWVSQHFAEIDSRQKGYITIADIRTYRQHMRAGQTVASTGAAPSQQTDQPAHRFLDRFSAANTSHDGRLTLEQAEAAHMPWVTNHFAAIDSRQKGYVTIQDVRSYRQHLQAERSEVD
jgi:Ca2+-binding EF-hand superfamily protein